MEQKVRTFTLESRSDALCLSAASIAADKPSAVVQLVHGMCEHKERYYPLMEFLASRGFACVIHDHRGHGGSVKSPEDLGYFYKGGYRAAVDDVRQVTLWAKDEYPGLPVFLFGHSMGSFITRNFIHEYGNEVDGAVISATGMQPEGLMRIMRKNCDIVKDLIPLYIDNVASEESKNLVETHCDTCKECKKFLSLSKETIIAKEKNMYLVIALNP